MSVDAPAPGTAEDAARTAVIAHLCEGAWQVIPDVTDRLREAGFGPGHWPELGELHRVAVLPKTAIAQLQAIGPPFGALRGPRAGRVKSLFCSPGQIFEPDMPSAESRLARILNAQGFAAGDVVLNGFNYHLTPAGLLFHNALTGIGCTVIPGGPQNTDALVDILVRSGAVGFVGIAAHLRVLLDRFFQLGHRPEQLTLRKAMAGGEPGASKIRDEFRSQCGIQVFDVYGTAEVGVVAVEGVEGAGMSIDSEVVVEIVDPVSSDPVPVGVPGHVVLTVDNPTYPMLRFGTGDLGRLEFVRTRGEPSTQKLFLMGRLGASARVRGMLLHEAQVRECMAADKAIQGVQIQIVRNASRDGIVAVLQAPAEKFPTASEAFASRFQALCRLRLDSVEASDGPLDADPLILDKRVY